MKKSTGLLAALACVLAPATASAQEVGDWVLSRWQGSTQYFPGVVVGRNGNQLRIQFDDGDVSVVPAKAVRPFDWVEGSAVECRWSDGNWYAARIRWISDNGMTMQVRYDDDGTVERTNTGKCRAGY